MKRARLSGVPVSGTGRRGADLARELHAVVAGDPDVTGYAGPVTLAGRVELVPLPREQAIDYNGPVRQPLPDAHRPAAVGAVLPALQVAG